MKEERKSDHFRIKNFCSANDHIRRMKRQVTDREKIFPTHLFDKELGSRIYQKLSKLNGKNQILQLEHKENSINRIHRLQISTQRNSQHHESLGKCKLTQCGITITKIKNGDNTKC